MPHDGAIIFSDLTGGLDPLRVPVTSADVMAAKASPGSSTSAAAAAR